MKFFTFLLLVGGLFLVGAAPAPAADATPRARHVFIISFDQGIPRLIQKYAMPTYQEMAREGAYTWHAYTIVPSLTLPSHTSMLTGVGIQKHQVTWNDLAPEKGFVKVPTIFSIAKEKGLVTAMYVSKIKFKTLQLPGSLDAFVLPADVSSKGVAAAFAEQVKTLKPNLCFIHFQEIDATGHGYGIESKEQIQAMADCDAALKVIKDAIASAGLLDSSVIILTSDHGGHNRSPEENEDRAKKGLPYMPGTHGSPDSVDVEIPWVAWGEGVKKGYEITAPVVQYDTAATALWLLGIPPPESFWGRPVTSAFVDAAPSKP